MATLVALALTVACVAGDGAPPLEALPESGQESEQTTEKPAGPSIPHYSTWLRLAQCESTQIWTANTGNGYYGGLQQDMSFWRRHGGLQFAARPDLATPTEQMAVAEAGLIAQGWAAWPACSRRLGLR